MCMQDLAISSRVTWRRVANLDTSVVGTVVVPPNPLRVSLAVRDTATPGVPAVHLGPAVASPAVNVVYDTVAASDLCSGVISSLDIPGVFGVPLYIFVPAANIDVYESVMDSTLSAQVQAVAIQMGP